MGSAFEGKGITDGEIYTHIDIDIGGTSRFFLNKAREKKREHEAPQWRWRADKAPAIEHILLLLLLLTHTIRETFRRSVHDSDWYVAKTVGHDSALQ